MNTDLDTKHRLRAAATDLHSFGFNVIPCGRRSKSGTWDFKAYSGKSWDKWQSTRQGVEDMEAEPWAAATGLALVHGVGNIRAFDFDAIKDTDGKVVRKVPFEPVQVLCTLLGLDPDSYEWLVETGNGWHMWVCCEDMSTEGLNGEDADMTKKEYPSGGPYKDSFGKLELRWKKHITVIPPSQHSEAKFYKFKNCTFPKSAPATVKTEHVVRAVQALCTIEKKQPAKVRIGKDKKPMTLRKFPVDKVRSMLSAIPSQQEHVTWKKTVAGVVDALGKDEAIPVLEEWSPSTVPYSEVIEAGLDRVTAGSLVHLAREYGWQDHEEPTKAELVQSFLLQSFELQYNELRRQVEYRAKDSDSWLVATDRTYEQWTVTFEKQCRRSLAVEKVRLYAQDEDVCRSYDPIKEYFDRLPAWDGEDHISKLAGCVRLQDEEHRDTFVLHLKKWLVGTFSCGYFGGVGGSKNELFLILQGPQGKGKTTFLRRIVPPELEAYKCENYDTTKKEDSLSILSKSFVCIDEELESMTKKEAASLKQLLSAESFEFRSSYGRVEQNHLRRVSFCGSVNHGVFLRDPTGSRRFLVHSFQSLNRAELRRVDIRQVWAQAKALHLEGFAHYLQEHEVETVQSMNTEFEVIDHIEELLVEFFRKPAGNESGEWKTCTEIANLIALKHYQQHGDNVGRLRVDSYLLNRLGSMLAKHGFERRKVKISGSTRQAYRVIPNSSTDGASIPPHWQDEDHDKPLF